MSEELIAHKGIDRAKLETVSNGKRVLAVLIDGVFLIIANSIINLIPLPEENNLLIRFVIGLVLGALYWIYPTFKYGQSIGKKLMNIKVVDFDNSPKLSMGQVLIREWPGKFISSFLMIGYIVGLCREDRRAWHDMMGSTKVVNL